MHNHCIAFAGILLVLPMGARGQTELTAEQVLQRISPSVALVLTGSSPGLMSAVGSALIMRSDGVLFAALPVVRNVGRVQIRLRTGDVYDQVEVIGYDQRRGVAALKIPAAGLPELRIGGEESAKEGDRVWILPHPGALPWSAASGSLGSLRLAEELPGIGAGFRVIQFAAAMWPGSTGAALVNGSGQALGIVVASGSVNQVNVAIPFSSVMGLVSGGTRVPLNPSLGIPSRTATPAGTSKRLANVDPEEILRTARSILVISKTSLFNPEVLATELRKLPEFQIWSLLIVNQQASADLVVTVDRPLFTFDFTYSISHPQTGLDLGSGKVVAADGVRAGQGLAKQVVNHLSKARSKPVPAPAPKPAAPKSPAGTR